MSAIKTEYGRNWAVDRILNGDDHPELQYVLIGSGDSDPVESDTELDMEEYKASVEDTNANIYKVGDLPGTYRVDITVSGGVEVDADTSISEFGIETADQDLVYREVRDPTVISSGERISFEIEVEFVNV